MNHAPAIILTLALAGCASAAYRPPPGVVWAYLAEFTPRGQPGSSVRNPQYPLLRTVGYTDSKERCEFARARDAQSTEQNHPWLLATFSEACQQAVVGPGGDYWAFGMPPWYSAGHAASTLHLCDSIRQNQITPPASAPTACALVSIHFLAPLPKGAQK